MSLPMPSTFLTYLNGFFILTCPLLLIFQTKLLSRFAGAAQSIRAKIWIGLVSTVLLWAVSLLSVIITLTRHKQG